MSRFDAEDFVGRCRSALEEPDPLLAIAEEVRRAVAEPGSFADMVHVPLDPDDDGILYRADNMMIVHTVFPAAFATGIHDHRIPAVIGTWAGYEDNHLYRRSSGGLELTGISRLEPTDVLVLREDAIHDVHAPRSTWTAGLHVYLGDLIEVSRSEWVSADSPEKECDGPAMEERWLESALRTGLVDRPANA